MESIFTHLCDGLLLRFIDLRTIWSLTWFCLETEVIHFLHPNISLKTLNELFIMIHKVQHKLLTVHVIETSDLKQKMRRRLEILSHESSWKDFYFYRLIKHYWTNGLHLIYWFLYLKLFSFKIVASFFKISVCNLIQTLLYFILYSLSRLTDWFPKEKLFLFGWIHVVAWN